MLRHILVLPRWQWAGLGPFRATARRAPFLAVAVAGVALSGCQKDEACEGRCIEVHGRVGSAAGSAVPLPGATVQLNFVYSGNGFFSKPDLVVRTVTSGADGRYALQFVPPADAPALGQYRLLYSKPGYDDEALGAGTTRAYEAGLQLAPGGRYEQNLHLPLRGGHLRIRITGFPGPTAANGTFLGVYSGQGRADDARTGSDLSLYDTATGSAAGRSNDLTDVSCLPAANDYAVVRLYKRKAGVTTLIQDSVYCPLNTPVTYTHAF